MSDADQYPKKPQCRLATIICDMIPSFGKIKEHRFTTSYGAGVVFTADNDIDLNGVRQGSFNLTVNAGSPLWSAIELRELAGECVEMAKYLEKKSIG